MDVVLLKDVEKLGSAGTVVHVKPGFARNYLMPAGLAAPATPQQLNALEVATRHRLQKVQRIHAEAEAFKRKLESRSLTLKLALGEDGKPFGSVTVHDIMEALTREGFEVEKHAIRLEQPIKALGIYEIPVQVHPQVTATLKLWVGKA
ncbi:MAG: 50S ribosomal protein L9 [Candidatus Omnitrophica bacterium]|nr:50S ribosomal protein L9 [Candidatus Omnitrophota bacterium]